VSRTCFKSGIISAGLLSSAAPLELYHDGGVISGLVTRLIVCVYVRTSLVNAHDLGQFRSDLVLSFDLFSAFVFVSIYPTRHNNVQRSMTITDRAGKFRDAWADVFAVFFSPPTQPQHNRVIGARLMDLPAILISYRYILQSWWSLMLDVNP
jgi:hypothetical protein